MKTEVIEKFSALITASFGLVAALAWNEAIQRIFKNSFGEQSSTPAMLVYAVIVTIIAFIITLWIGRLAEHAKNMRLSLRRPKLKEQEAQKSKSR